MWVASAYALFSIIVARASAFGTPEGNLASRIFLTWILLVPASILVESGLFPFVLAAIVLFFLKPTDPVERTAYFLGVLPAMVDRYSYHIPFPGMTFLIELNYFKIAVIILLLPIAFSSVKANVQDNRSKRNLIDVCVMAFVLYVAILSIRDTSLTNMLRVFVDQLITFAVPYFVLTRFLCTRKAFNKALWALYFMAVITAWVVLVQTLYQWEFYRIHIPAVRFFRDGFLRISTTVNTASVCTIAVTGILVAQHFRRRSLIPTYQVWLIQPLFAASIYFTGNRGGMLQLGIALVVMFIVTKLSAGTKKIVSVSMLLGSLMAIGAWNTFDWSSVDSTGTTFQFRADLITAAIPVFFENPLFGQHDYTDSPHFDHLDQSSRILGEDRFIDMANWYLSVLLLYGLVGLVLFAFPLLKTTSWLYGQLSSYDSNNEEEQLYLCLFCMLVPFLVVIGTTSGISYMPVFAIVFLAMGRALMGFEQSPKTG